MSGHLKYIYGHINSKVKNFIRGDNRAARRVTHRDSEKD